MCIYLFITSSSDQALEFETHFSEQTKKVVTKKNKKNKDNLFIIEELDEEKDESKLYNLASFPATSLKKLNFSNSND